MTELKSVDNILEFAIRQEEKAEAMYLRLAGKAGHAHMKQSLEEFAAEERRHKQILQQIHQNGGLRPSAEQIATLGLAEMLREVDEDTEMDYQQLLIFAMQREKDAFRMYSSLAEIAQDEKLRLTLQSLAQEEAKHKLRFEIEYDQTILTEG
ncbi:MAG: ferritin family protein [Pseudomonadota bacterium]